VLLNIIDLFLDWSFLWNTLNFLQMVLCLPHVEQWVFYYWTFLNLLSLFTFLLFLFSPFVLVFISIRGSHGRPVNLGVFQFYLLFCTKYINVSFNWKISTLSLWGMSQCFLQLAKLFRFIQKNVDFCTTYNEKKSYTFHAFSY